MPSPFPGMDPYLEDWFHFPDSRDSFITYIREFLQARLPEPYFAVIGRREWVEESRRSIGPDVAVCRPKGSSSPRQPSGESGVEFAATTRSRPVVVTVPEDEHRETMVEIHIDHSDNPCLVTLIEVLSLVDKTPGTCGRGLYLSRRQEELESSVQLVEIDLLRGGTHTTAVPRDLAVERAGPFDYHVCVRLFDRPREFLVYPIRMQEQLPEIAIPLLPSSLTVPLDLQAVFDRCYDTGPYRRRSPYREDEVKPPLSKEQARWAAGVLKEKGIALLPPYGPF
jgi:hypothetical protein